MRQVRFLFVLCAAAAAGGSAGCGGKAGNQATLPDKFESVELAQVGEMIRLYAEEHKKPPARAADLKAYVELFPPGQQALQSGKVVVLWGTPLDNKEAVLAHEKDTPAKGGLVLMADTITVRQMTADEFKAAPKAKPR